MWLGDMGQYLLCKSHSPICTSWLPGLLSIWLNVRQSYETRSNVAIMLTHPEPELIILGYAESEEGTATLAVKKQLSLFERLPRIAEFFTGLLVHPSGKIAVVSCYAGKLKIIKLKGGSYGDDFDVSCVSLSRALRAL